MSKEAVSRNQVLWLVYLTAVTGVVGTLLTGGNWVVAIICFALGVVLVPALIGVIFGRRGRGRSRLDRRNAANRT